MKKNARLSFNLKFYQDHILAFANQLTLLLVCLIGWSREDWEDAICSAWEKV